MSRILLLTRCTSALYIADKVLFIERLNRRRTLALVKAETLLRLVCLLVAILLCFVLYIIICPCLLGRVAHYAVVSGLIGWSFELGKEFVVCKSSLWQPDDSSSACVVEINASLYFGGRLVALRSTWIADCIFNFDVVFFCLSHLLLRNLLLLPLTMQGTSTLYIIVRPIVLHIILIIMLSFLLMLLYPEYVFSSLSVLRIYDTTPSFWTILWGWHHQVNILFTYLRLSIYWLWFALFFERWPCNVVLSYTRLIVLNIKVLFRFLLFKDSFDKTGSLRSVMSSTRIT